MKNKLQIIETFLKEAWVVDGDVKRTEEKIPPNYDSLTFKLNDSKRGKFFITMHAIHQCDDLNEE